jgi:hypothetical protein
MGSLEGQDMVSFEETPRQPASRLPFKMVMHCLSTSDLDQAYGLCIEHRFRPKLGQLLIASGRLSAGDLESMLSVHDSQALRNLPMGKLLVISGLLTATELRQYLTLQKMLRLPSDHHERWGQKLVEDGLLTQEQLNIALSDRLLKKMTLKEAIVARGWMSDERLSCGSMM